MPRPRITITDDLQSEIEAYQQEHGYKSFAETCVELLRIGLAVETGQEPPEAHKPRGGWQGNLNSLTGLKYIDSLTDYGRNDPTE